MRCGGNRESLAPAINIHTTSCFIHGVPNFPGCISDPFRLEAHFIAVIRIVGEEFQELESSGGNHVVGAQLNSRSKEFQTLDQGVKQRSRGGESSKNFERD